MDGDPCRSERLAENPRAGKASRRLHAARKNPPLATGPKFRENSQPRSIRRCAVCCKSHTQRNSVSRIWCPGSAPNPVSPRETARSRKPKRSATEASGPEAQSQSAAQAVMARGWLLTKTAEPATSTAITAASAKNFIARNFIVVAPLCAGKWTPDHCASFDISVRRKFENTLAPMRLPRGRELSSAQTSRVCRHRRSLRVLRLFRLFATTDP
jgi:hypothetical protein